MAFATVDEYIASYPDDVQEILQEVRRRIGRAVPGSGETIRYDMPTVTVGGRSLVHYAAWKRHLALYPMPALGEPLDGEVAGYRAAKDAVHFRYREPVPFDLIERLVVRLAELRGSRPAE
jgi:uncharacterized protein YdhG (YjbR/CyaY superfamily)